MKKNEAPPSPTLAELVESNTRLVEENAILESAVDAALAAGHRHLGQLKTLRVVARAIARRPMLEDDRIVLAGALKDLCSQAHTEASLHLQQLSFARNCRSLSASLSLVDDDPFVPDCSPTRH